MKEASLLQFTFWLPLGTEDEGNQSEGRWIVWNLLKEKGFRRLFHFKNKSGACCGMGNGGTTAVNNQKKKKKKNTRANIIASFTLIFSSLLSH